MPSTERPETGIVKEERSTRLPGAQGLLRWLYVGRVTLAIAIFIAAAFEAQSLPPETIVLIAVAAIASVLLSGWAFWYTEIRGQPSSRTFLYSQSLFDVALVTTVVHVTGGPASQFPALYIVVIAVSAVLMPLTSSLLITTLASLLYVADIVWWQDVSVTSAVWLQIAVFVGVFLVTGLLASRAQVAEREARRATLEAGDILRNIRSGVVTVDGDGNLVFANPAARDLLGPDISDTGFVSALSDRAPELARLIKATQQRSLGSLRGDGVVLREGRPFPIGFTITPLDAEGSAPYSVAAIFTDISDQRRLQELRLRTERLEAVAELSASLAHEIKNPLATIRSSVEQLGVSERSNDDERILVNLVVRESDRLSRLLTEFLDFSRVRVTSCRTIKLSEVVKDAVVVVQQHPDCTDGVTIVVDAQPVKVEGDEDLLHRVVVNLVLNAVQVCNGKCRIAVELREAEASELPREFRLETGVLLKVTDSGPGIPSHLRDRLFEPFVSDRDGGSGLGLAIVQRAVQAHRGVIWTDSDPTTFTVVLPSKRAAEVNS